MDGSRKFDSEAGSSAAYTPLAVWLQRVMAPPGLEVEASSSDTEGEQLKLLHDHEDHLRFYQQLPDFVMALLNNDPLLNVHYASLFYHLIGCATCHNAYLELYRALRATVQGNSEPHEVSPPARPLATVPPRTLVHLCQLLIGQAELVLRQPLVAGDEGSQTARTLLRQAIQISAHMTQMRSRALQDLVRVAALYEGVGAAPLSPHEPPAYSYSLQLASGGVRQGKKIRRRADMVLRSPDVPLDQPVIVIQANALEGMVTQQGAMLYLSLHDLDAPLRGKPLTISLPLGSLIEPVRWLGGNPGAIRSATQVDEEGQIVLPLGETSLRLDNAEERNLLEVLFMRVEVRTVD